MRKLPLFFIALFLASWLGAALHAAEHHHEDEHHEEESCQICDFLVQPASSDFHAPTVTRQQPPKFAVPTRLAAFPVFSLAASFSIRAPPVSA